MSRRQRAYRGLLRLFPADFRHERGAGMERTFLDMCAAWEAERGRLGVGFWAALTWDTGREAFHEWLSLVRESIRSNLTRSPGEHMSAFVADVRFALRQLVREPLYGTTIVLLMALGIAGNTAMFRVFNGLFLRPLPFEDPGRLVDIDETAPRWDLEFLSIAYRDYVAWQERNTTFESMAVFDFGGGNFVDDGAADRVSYLLTTHTMDDVLGLEPVLGRFYGPEEDQPDGARGMLLTQGFWEQRFASDPAVLGRTVTVNGYPVEVIGVLPPEARFVGDVDLWMPLRQTETEFQGWGLNGLARMRPGVTIEQARADLMSIHKGLIDQWEVNEISSPVVNQLRDRYLGDYRLGSGFLLGAVAVVLLIACANIAGLMTARSMARGDEIAVRLAMGAPRMRIVRQLLTESLVLATVGAAIGTTLGVWGSARAVQPLAEQFPRWVTFDLDGRFVAFTVLVTVAATLLFGLVPALHASGGRRSVAATHRHTASRSRQRGMSLLVTGQVALALSLLVVGGLSVLDVARLGNADPGFATEGVLSYQLTLPSTRYPDGPARLAFVDEYLPRLEAIPGVEVAAVTSTMPLTGHWGWFFQVDGAPARAEDEGDPVVLNRVVSPGYFETLGVSFVAGRPFDRFDGTEDGNQAIIVNETFVRTHLSHLTDPIGARVSPGTDPPDPDDPMMTVIGVTRDVKHYGLDQEMRPGVYQPLPQFPMSGFAVALRTRGNMEAIVTAARSVTAEMDVELPLYNVETMAEELDASLWTRRAMSGLIGGFAAVALLLAVAGIYGVVSYGVGQRTREISIRMAMGARREQVLGQVVRGGMALVALGVAVGLGLSIAGARLVSGILVGVSATDPIVYLGVTALLVCVAVLANYLPARRAARLDPMIALRRE